MIWLAPAGSAGRIDDGTQDELEGGVGEAADLDKDLALAPSAAEAPSPAAFAAVVAAGAAVRSLAACHLHIYPASISMALEVCMLAVGFRRQKRTAVSDPAHIVLIL
jgi:hypothetical protein